MNLYTLRGAAKLLSLSYETVRRRLQALKAQGVDLPQLIRDNDTKDLVPEDLLDQIGRIETETVDS